MGCNCGKKKRATGWGTSAPRTIPAEVTPSGKPVRYFVEFDDGEVRDYATKLEAHTAKLIRGGRILDGDPSETNPSSV